MFRLPHDAVAAVVMLPCRSLGPTNCRINSSCASLGSHVFIGATDARIADRLRHLGIDRAKFCWRLIRDLNWDVAAC